MRGVLALACLMSASITEARLLAEPEAATVQRIAQLARANLTLARLPDGSNVPPESEAELAVPIVPTDLDTQTVRRGALTGELQVCGVDWAGVSFIPYMTRLRESDRYSPKQLAYLGIVHGAMQSTTYNTMQPYVRSCSRGRIKSLTRMAAEPIVTP